MSSILKFEDASLGDQKIKRGAGGETHQSDMNEPLTTQLGIRVGDNQNSLKIHERGETLLEDPILREKIFHFDHERIPERIVHARGYGAHGYFELYDSLSDISMADLFQRPGEKTEVFVRFSTVVGSKGSFDLARDVRGFAVKFYTKDGNWDIVSNNIPVFFIQDAIKFPDLIHSAKPEPDRDFPQAQTAHDNFWDFISLMPESMHMVMWIMSDRTIPRSFRFMEGFGVHSFRLVNEEGKSTFVKFHWKPKLGLQSVVWNEAQKINGADPDFHRRDLWASINKGDYPEWELGLQVFDQDFADSFEFDILDSTKLIPEERVPIRRVGRLVLNRMPDNFFAETEQVAFCTNNIVPGIDFTPDPLLQGRNFSYLDTQLKRLGGPNFFQIPVNAPRCPISNFQRDGHMQMRVPKGRVNYEPNSWGEGPREQFMKGFHSYPAPTAASVKQRTRSATFADHYSQARQFYLSQTEVERKHIGDALIFELSRCENIAIRKRMVAHLRCISESLAQRVGGPKGLNLPEMPEMMTPARPVIELEPSPKLSIVLNGPQSFKGRKLGIFVSEGVDRSLFDAMVAACENEGSMYEVVAVSVGGVKDSNRERLEADKKISGGPSVLYDAVALLLTKEAVPQLAELPTAKDFVSDAFSHCKFIGYTTASELLLKNAGVKIDSGFMDLSASNDSPTRFIHMCRELRYWDRELQLWPYGFNETR